MLADTQMATHMTHRGTTKSLAMRTRALTFRKGLDVKARCFGNQIKDHTKACLRRAHKMGTIIRPSGIEAMASSMITGLTAQIGGLNGVVSRVKAFGGVPLAGAAWTKAKNRLSLMGKYGRWNNNCLLWEVRLYKLCRYFNFCINR